jgi:hypothetical protein
LKGCKRNRKGDINERDKRKKGRINFRGMRSEE